MDLVMMLDGAEALDRLHRVWERTQQASDAGGLSISQFVRLMLEVLPPMAWWHAREQLLAEGCDVPVEDVFPKRADGEGISFDIGKATDKEPSHVQQLLARRRQAEIEQRLAELSSKPGRHGNKPNRAAIEQAAIDAGDEETMAGVGKPLLEVVRRPEAATVRLCALLMELFEEVDINNDREMDWSELTAFVADVGIVATKQQVPRPAPVGYRERQNFVDVATQSEVSRLQVMVWPPPPAAAALSAGMSRAARRARAVEVWVMEENSPRIRVYDAGRMEARAEELDQGEKGGDGEEEGAVHGHGKLHDRSPMLLKYVIDTAKDAGAFATGQDGTPSSGPADGTAAGADAAGAGGGPGSGGRKGGRGTGHGKRQRDKGRAGGGSSGAKGGAAGLAAQLEAASLPRVTAFAVMRDTRPQVAAVALSNSTISLYRLPPTGPPPPLASLSGSERRRAELIGALGARGGAAAGGGRKQQAAAPTTPGGSPQAGAGADDDDGENAIIITDADLDMHKRGGFELLASLATHSVTSRLVSHGSMLLTHSAAEPGYIEAWNVRKRAVIHRLRLHADAITDMMFLTPQAMGLLQPTRLASKAAAAGSDSDSEDGAGAGGGGEGAGALRAAAEARGVLLTASMDRQVHVYEPLPESSRVSRPSADAELPGTSAPPAGPGVPEPARTGLVGMENEETALGGGINRLACFLGHTHGVRQLCFVPSLCLLVSIGFEAEGLCWDLLDGKLFLRLRGHRAPLVSVSEVWQGRRAMGLAGAGPNAMPQPLAPERRAEAEAGLVLSRVLTMDATGVFKLWALTANPTGVATCLLSFDTMTAAHSQLAKFSVGNMVALPHTGEMVVGGSKLHHYWPITFATNPPVANAALYNPVTRSFALFTSAASEVSLRILSGRTGRQQAIVHNVAAHPVSAVCLDDRMRKLIIGTQDGRIHVVNQMTGQRMKDAERPHRQGQEVTALLYVQRDRRVVSAGWDGAITICDEDPPDKLTSVARHDLAHPDADILTADLDETLQLIATGAGDGGVRVWDYDTLKPEGSLDGHVQEVTGTQFVKQFPVLVVADGAGNICLWGVRGAGKSHDRAALLSLRNTRAPLAARWRRRMVVPKPQSNQIARRIRGGDDRKRAKEVAAESAGESDGEDTGSDTEGELLREHAEIAKRLAEGAPTQASTTAVAKSRRRRRSSGHGGGKEEGGAGRQRRRVDPFKDQRSMKLPRANVPAVPLGCVCIGEWDLPDRDLEADMKGVPHRPASAATTATTSTGRRHTARHQSPLRAMAGHHPSTYRAESGRLRILVTGDDEGRVRVWSLSHMLARTGLGQFQRGVGRSMAERISESADGAATISPDAAVDEGAGAESPGGPFAATALHPIRPGEESGMFGAQGSIGRGNALAPVDFQREKLQAAGAAAGAGAGMRRGRRRSTVRRIDTLLGASAARRERRASMRATRDDARRLAAGLAGGHGSETGSALGVGELGDTEIILHRPRGGRRQAGRGRDGAADARHGGSAARSAAGGPDQPASSGVAEALSGMGYGAAGGSGLPGATAQRRSTSKFLSKKGGQVGGDREGGSGATALLSAAAASKRRRELGRSRAGSTSPVRRRPGPLTADASASPAKGKRINRRRSSLLAQLADAGVMNLVTPGPSPGAPTAAGSPTAGSPPVVAPRRLRPTRPGDGLDDDQEEAEEAGAGLGGSLPGSLVAGGADEEASAAVRAVARSRSLFRRLDATMSTPVLAEWHAHSAPIVRIQFIVEPPSLLTVASDASVRVWTLRGECLGSLNYSPTEIQRIQHGEQRAIDWRFRVDEEALRRERDLAARQLLVDVADQEVSRRKEARRSRRKADLNRKIRGLLSGMLQAAGDPRGAHTGLVGAVQNAAGMSEAGQTALTLLGGSSSMVQVLGRLVKWGERAKKAVRSRLSRLRRKKRPGSAASGGSTARSEDEDEDEDDEAVILDAAANSEFLRGASTVMLRLGKKEREAALVLLRAEQELAEADAAARRRAAQQERRKRMDASVGELAKRKPARDELAASGGGTVAALGRTSASAATDDGHFRDSQLASATGRTSVWLPPPVAGQTTPRGAAVEADWEARVGAMEARHARYEAEQRAFVQVRAAGADRAKAIAAAKSATAKRTAAGLAGGGGDGRRRPMSRVHSRQQGRPSAKRPDSAGSGTGEGGDLALPGLFASMREDGADSPSGGSAAQARAVLSGMHKRVMGVVRQGLPPGSEALEHPDLGGQDEGAGEEQAGAAASKQQTAPPQPAGEQPIPFKMDGGYDDDDDPAAQDAERVLDMLEDARTAGKLLQAAQNRGTAGGQGDKAYGHLHAELQRKRAGGSGSNNSTLSTLRASGRKAAAASSSSTAEPGAAVAEATTAFMTARSTARSSGRAMAGDNGLAPSPFLQARMHQLRGRGKRNGSLSKGGLSRKGLSQSTSALPSRRPTKHAARARVVRKRQQLQSISGRQQRMGRRNSAVADPDALREAHAPGTSTILLNSLRSVGAATTAAAAAAATTAPLPAASPAPNAAGGSKPVHVPGMLPPPVLPGVDPALVLAAQSPSVVRVLGESPGIAPARRELLLHLAVQRVALPSPRPSQEASAAGEARARDDPEPGSQPLSTTDRLVRPLEADAAVSRRWTEAEKRLYRRAVTQLRTHTVEAAIAEAASGAAGLRAAAGKGPAAASHQNDEQLTRTFGDLSTVLQGAVDAQARAGAAAEAEQLRRMLASRGQGKQQPQAATTPSGTTSPAVPSPASSPASPVARAAATDGVVAAAAGGGGSSGGGGGGRQGSRFGRVQAADIRDAVRLFARFDLDGSGSVSATELAASPEWRNSTFGSLGGHAGSMFTSIDKDRSGTLELNEFLAALFPGLKQRQFRALVRYAHEVMGAEGTAIEAPDLADFDPSSVGLSPRSHQQVLSLFDALDQDGNGFLPVSQAFAALKAGATRARGTGRQGGVRAEMTLERRRTRLRALQRRTEIDLGKPLTPHQRKQLRINGRLGDAAPVQDATATAGLPLPAVSVQRRLRADADGADAAGAAPAAPEGKVTATQLEAAAQSGLSPLATGVLTPAFFASMAEKAGIDPTQPLRKHDFLRLMAATWSSAPGAQPAGDAGRGRAADRLRELRGQRGGGHGSGAVGLHGDGVAGALVKVQGGVLGGALGPAQDEEETSSVDGIM